MGMVRRATILDNGTYPPVAHELRRGGFPKPRFPGKIRELSFADRAIIPIILGKICGRVAKNRP